MEINKTIYQQYVRRFGETFKAIQVLPLYPEEADSLMLEALMGDRGPVVDADFGIDIPEDARY